MVNNAKSTLMGLPVMVLLLCGPELVSNLSVSCLGNEK